MRVRYRNALAVMTIGVLAIAACETDDRAVDRDEVAPPVTEEPAAAPDVQVPEGATAEQVAMGRQLFTGQGGCHACHGPQATGTQLAPDMTDDNWLNVAEPTMAEVERVIREGVAQPVQYPAPMPPMGGARLNDEQIQALAAYVLSLN